MAINEQKYQMTVEGKTQLEQELEQLINIKRPEVVERIQVARSFGDLSENSEYDAAKEEQAFVESRITQIEVMLKNSEIIESHSSNEVSFGSTVSFKIIGEKNEQTYKIVGSAESDPFEGKISNDSPIAKALIGKKIGQKVKFNAPSGEVQLQVTKID
ncbi:MAG: transcription elongation factor GreA [Culicoidibacterales bacterium]